jgi:hypothetical protein
MMAMGWEGVITRHMVLGGRRRPRQTYTGTAAILQGIQLNFIGLFLIGMAFMMQFDNAEQIFLHLVRRPGLPLVLLGGLCLLQAMILFFGSQQAREGSGGIAIVSLLFSRLLPGVILVVIGVGLGALGLFDTLAPARFDEMGGALLEAMYGVR